MKFHHQTLPNGLQIVAECNPHALSAAVGFFVRAGSRDETPEIAGVSHFLEHMAFKGSAQRSAEEVNQRFDDIGAKYNAFTTEEHTAYHAAVLPEYLPTAVDLLGDLLRPALRADDFDMEKKVILEEIGMYADSPMWCAYEQAVRTHFLDHPLGNTVLGTNESVAQLSPAAMRSYYGCRYSPNNTLLAAAGKIEWPVLLDLAMGQCGNWQEQPVGRELCRVHRSGTNQLLHRDAFVQECLCMIAPGPASESPMRFAAEVLANIIGDDTGSRFYWDLVEPGHVESIDFSYHEYEGMGAFMVSAGFEPELTESNLATIRRILVQATEEGVTAEELELAKNKLGARMVIAAERPQNRLFSVAYNWSYRTEQRSVSDDLRDLEAVTLDDIRALLEAYPLRRLTTVCLGPLPELATLDA